MLQKRSSTDKCIGKCTFVCIFTDFKTFIQIEKEYILAQNFQKSATLMFVKKDEVVMGIVQR